jgi:KaiC/GvpD/RAD55 family RecA-like ATPase
MHRELRFIAGLLLAPKKEQNEVYAKGLSLKVFKAHDAEIRWVLDYRRKYGAFPSTASFDQKFNTKLFKVKEPLSALYEELVQFDLYAQISTVVEKTSDLYDKKEDMRTVVSFFRDQVSAIDIHSDATQDVEVKGDAALLRYKRFAHDLRKGVGGVVFDTPWPSMTALITSCRPGEMITLYGRPALGKTWYALMWANHLANKGASVLVVSKEMMTHSIQDRFDAIQHRLNWTALRQGKLSPLAIAKWNKSIQRNKYKGRLVVTGEETLEGVGVDSILAKIQKYSPDFVLVDGAYLIEFPGVKFNSDVARFTHLTRLLKRIAKFSSVVLMPVVQMNRAGEDKTGVSKGGAVTIYGSDSWLQDSDYAIEVLGMRGESHRRLRITKARETAIGDVSVHFRFEPVNLGELISKKAAVYSNLDLKV